MAVAPTVEAVVAAGGTHIPPLMEALDQRLAELAAGHGAVLARHGGATIAAGGKRLRPLLVFVAAGEAADPGVLRVAVAVELLHSATLVHDDVLDAAELRRGRPTVVATAGRGIATATGDLLFSRAFAELRANGRADSFTGKVSRVSKGTRVRAAESGEAAENLTEKILPLVYDELRRLAAHRMAGQQPGQTLQATALVHEAYLRLVGQDEPDRQHWDGRGHFFAAAAEAMRRILIDRARQKQSLKRGGDQARTTWDESKVGDAAAPEEILAVDEALTKLHQEDPDLAKIVNLRYFAGMTVPETAAALGVSPSTVDRQWACARAWLFREITEGNRL